MRSKCFFIIFVVFYSLQAQVDWYRLNDNPVFTTGALGSWESSHVLGPEVKYIDGEYKMWYSGLLGAYVSEIGLATSPDGITWTRESSNPVIAKGPYGTWDDYSISGATIVYKDSTYHAWYAGDDSVHLSIGYAISSDGITWQKYANNPVMAPAGNANWTPLYIWSGTVLVIDSVFHMWYSGQSANSVLQIGHATSTDGIEWSQDTANPVLRVGASGTIDGRSM